MMKEASSSNKTQFDIHSQEASSARLQHALLKYTAAKNIIKENGLRLWFGSNALYTAPHNEWMIAF